MFNLPATKYQTTQRTANGTVPVFPDDVVLNCDTSTAAVVIELAEIPDDFFSTQYKLYVVDISNNASVNNITIVAGAGQTINSAASIQITTNGGSVVVMISGNTSYTALQSNALIGPSSFIPVTYVQLSNLISTNTIIPNADYLLLDAQFGNLPIIPTNVYLKGITLNKVSLDGQGIFYNADYQNLGIYTGIIGFAGQLGLWNLGLTPIVNNVCIWDNIQYLNNTGANGLTNPTLDNVNWQPLARQDTFGYIVEIDVVYYNSTTNNITFRLDKNGNQVENTTSLGFNSFNCFKWGDNKVFQNAVLNNSICNNCNLIITGTLIAKPFFSNVFTETFISFGLLPNINGSVNVFSNNKINNSTITIENQAFEFLNNKIYNSNVSAGISTINGKFNNNIIETTILELGNCSGAFENNEINFSNLNIPTNSGSLSLNVINNVNSIAIRNYSSFSENNILNINNFLLQNNNGFFNNNIIKNCTIFQITSDNQGNFIENNIINNKNFSINLLTNNGDVNSNTIKCSDISIDTLDIIFSNCTLSNSIFKILNTTSGNGDITNLNCDNVNLGNPFVLSFSLTQKINGTAMSGVNTTKFILDCSDPLIYDLATQKLTISNDINLFFGHYVLNNASGLTISNVVNLSENWNSKFEADFGTVTFSSVNIGVAVANNIVSQNGTFLFNVVYRIEGSDYIELINNTNLITVAKAVILT